MEYYDRRDEEIADLRKRLAEAEENLRSWMETADQFATRATAAEAKLGQIKKSINQGGWGYGSDTMMDWIEETRDEINAILADPRKVLAVVDGYAWDDDEWWSDSNYLWVSNYETGTTIPVTVIVLEKEER